MSNIIKIEKEEETKERLHLMKQTVCKDLNDLEFELFASICKKADLDPFTKQIYAMKIAGKMTIMTGIDGLRSIAERTGNYSPGREPTFQYDKEGNLISATAYVKKWNREWNEVGATAFFKEYNPGNGNKFWKDKPHIMISKCAEALAIRRAFPAVTMNLYTEEEMAQAKNSPSIPLETAQKSPIEVKAESNQPSAPIVDSKPKEWPPEGFEEMEPLERLQRLLNRDGIPFDKLEEWIDCRCCMISRSKEWLIAACLEKFPKFKDTFTAWLTIPTPDFAAG